MKKTDNKITFTTALALGLICSLPVFSSELEIQPSLNETGIKIAAITFLPDWMGDDTNRDIGIDINRDTKWCEKQGFTYGCPEMQAAYEVCDRDSNYVKCDKATWCKNNNYKTSSCSLPSYLDQQCPNGEKLYKGCKENKPQACKDIGYTQTCPSGQKLYNTTNRCSWDNSFGKCCTPSGCPAHTSLTGTYGNSGSDDGCGYACKYTCNMSCPSGTSETNPGGCGGSVKNGCNTKTCYNPYKACCTPYASETNCYYGTTSCSDGCGGTRTCCSSPPPPPSCTICYSNCSYLYINGNSNGAMCDYTISCDDGSVTHNRGTHCQVGGVYRDGVYYTDSNGHDILKAIVIDKINSGACHDCRPY